MLVKRSIYFRIFVKLINEILYINLSIQIKIILLYEIFMFQFIIYWSLDPTGMPACKATKTTRKVATRGEWQR
jgi:hypothetical protein